MNEIAEKAKHIKLLILDVDGVLTTGQLIYSEHGESLKAFNVKDGLGIKLLQKVQIKTAVITSRHSQIVSNRMNELGVEFVFQGQTNKIAAYENLMLTLGLDYQNIAYMGDDLPDLALIKKSGLGIAVADAHAAVIASADWITKKKGGKGAVREVADFIIEAQQKTQEIMEYFS